MNKLLRNFNFTYYRFNNKKKYLKVADPLIVRINLFFFSIVTNGHIIILSWIHKYQKKWVGNYCSVLNVQTTWKYSIRNSVSKHTFVIDLISLKVFQTWEFSQTLDIIILFVTIFNRKINIELPTKYVLYFLLETFNFTMNFINLLIIYIFLPYFSKKFAR